MCTYRSITRVGYVELYSSLQYDTVGVAAFHRVGLYRRVTGGGGHGFDGRGDAGDGGDVTTLTCSKYYLFRLNSVN